MREIWQQCQERSAYVELKLNMKSMFFIFYSLLLITKMDQCYTNKNRSQKRLVWLFMKVEFIKMDIIERLKTGEWRENGGYLSPLVLRLVLG